MLRHVFAINVEFQIVCASQLRDESLIGIRIRPAQLVIEMNDGENNPEFSPQLDQQPEERN